MMIKMVLLMATICLVFYFCLTYKFHQYLDNTTNIDPASISQQSEDVKHKINSLLARITILNSEAQSKKCVISFYADKFHGKTCADGSKFDMTANTCAHNSLPFGAWVLFYNPANGRFAVAQVTDRGAFNQYGREFDVSLAVAKQLNFVTQGIAEVEYVVLILF